MAKVLEQGPVMVLVFQAQQLTTKIDTNGQPEQVTDNAYIYHVIISPSPYYRMTLRVFIMCGRYVEIRIFMILVQHGGF